MQADVSFPPMSAPSAVQVVVQSACRRRFLVVLTEQLSLAVTLVLCGGILMLLLGTQILRWYWLVLLAAMGLTFVAFRVRKRSLASYRVAQILDHRLRLSDSLSTAWFLLTHPDVRREPIAHIQIQNAEILASGIRPASAFPFTGRRSWAVTGALAAAGFGLFAVRYLVTSTLSLREPLVPIHFESVVERLREALPSGAPGEKSEGAPGNAKRERASGAQQNDAQRLLQTAGSDQPGTPDPQGRSQVQAQNQSAEAKSGNVDDGSADPKGNGQLNTAQARAGDQQNGDPKGPQQTASTKELDSLQSAGNQQNSNGLLNRMRDALSDLMAKMRQNDAARKQGESSRASDEKKSGEQIASNNEEGSQAQQSATNQQARQQQASQGQGQTTEKAQSSQGANQLADKKGSDSQSGIGRQDGDKSLKEAEEQNAMGKLADIIGKRSASVTGDMTVETGSGKQQLQTRFTGRMGVHSDTGGEIDRDEIPVEFQPYVRAYMEQIRKQQTKTQ